MCFLCSDDEGEPDDEDEDEDEDGEEEEEEDEDEEEEEDDAKKTKENGVSSDESSPIKPENPASLPHSDSCSKTPQSKCCIPEQFHRPLVLSPMFYSP